MVELEDLICKLLVLNDIGFFVLLVCRLFVIKYFALGSLWILEDLTSPFHCSYSYKKRYVNVHSQGPRMWSSTNTIFQILFPSYTTCFKQAKKNFRNQAATFIKFSYNLFYSLFPFLFYFFCFHSVELIFTYWLFTVLLKTIIEDVKCLLLILSEM